VRGTESLDCGLRVEDCAKLWPRLQPVDADTGFAQIRAAIAARKHWTPADYDAVEFRDDKAKNGYTVFASSPAAYLTALKRQRVPVQYWGSWMDAGTAEAALSRYRSMPDLPMEVWLTANNHGNHQRTDPLLPLVKAPAPAFDTQFDSMIAFLARLRAGKTIERSIHYYVLGADQFRTTPVWPPADAHTTRFRFAPDRALVSAATPLADGQDRVPVDFTASSGRATRWTTQLGEAAAYPDRRDEDDKLLAYTSAPFERDMELVGTPSVHLFVASETSDPAFFVYLEDVAPDGRVTYLTEALFRAIHRKPADVAKLPYAQPQPASSFARADAMKMQPGQIAEVSFPAFPVAALLRQGHRLRVAIAGADADTFHRYSEGRDDAFTVERSTVRPSGIDVNLRPWTP
jgi:putative CocE/NonD family hydrolase